MVDKEKIREYGRRYREKNRDKVRERKRKYRENNKDKIKIYNKKYHKKWYQKNKYKLEFKENQKEYRKKNEDRIKEYQREYREKNREERLKEKKRYAQENKDKYRRYSKNYRQSERGKQNKMEWIRKNRDKIKLTKRKLESKRRLRLKDYVNPIGISVKNQKRIIERDKVCIYCSNNNNLTIDHIVPINKGGTNDFNNIALCCIKCNSSKGAKNVFKWCEEKGIKIPEIVNELLQAQREQISLNFNKSYNKFIESFKY